MALNTTKQNLIKATFKFEPSWVFPGHEWTKLDDRIMSGGMSEHSVIHIARGTRRKLKNDYWSLGIYEL